MKILICLSVSILLINSCANKEKQKEKSPTKIENKKTEKSLKKTKNKQIEKNLVLKYLKTNHKNGLYIVLAVLKNHKYKVPEINYDKPYAEVRKQLTKLIKKIKTLPEKEIKKLNKAIKDYTKLFSPIYPGGGSGWQ
jgi:hypothetical protein